MLVGERDRRPDFDSNISALLHRVEGYDDQADQDYNGSLYTPLIDGTTAMCPPTIPMLAIK